MSNKIQADFSSIHKVNIGIKEKDRKTICKGLNRLLADSYFLHLKTQNYHWNVTGPFFVQLHSLFEVQYKEIASSIDSIAERIRMLDEFAPGSFANFSKFTTIKEEIGTPSAEEMIQNLLQGNEAVVTTARELISITDESEDDVTADLLIQRMQVHEKNAWVLRSLLHSRTVQWM